MQEEKKDTEKLVTLNLTKDHAKKLYGVIALTFKNYEDRKAVIGEQTIMRLIPIHEALAVQIDRLDGHQPDTSDISAEAKKIGNLDV